MSLACIASCASLGLDAPSVTVEVHLSGGLPGITVVGLPETVVRESRDRVRSALLNSGFSLPPQRITINLAPADLPKAGGRYDLPIALGILVASGQLPPTALEGMACLGELALSGSLRPVPGALSAALACQRRDQQLLLPQGNADIATLLPNARLRWAGSLAEVAARLCGRASWPAPHPVAPPAETAPASSPDLMMVRGQALARRALEIAACGGHSLLMQGAPGAGKTLLASCLPGLLPPLDAFARLEVCALRSLQGLIGTWDQTAPFRAPHHSASMAALIGGGSGMPSPGEISLAHQGVLFLDELPEFSRSALEALREPLEAGEVTISRSRHQVRYPARFQLVAAMNPCPCGHRGDSPGNTLAHQGSSCRCTPEQLSRYRARLSGPLLDRIDLRITVHRLPLTALDAATPAESSACVRARVINARTRQLARQGTLNRQLTETHTALTLTTADRHFLQQAGERTRLSARGYQRVLHVARSIADLADEPVMRRAHVAEALGFRGDWS